MDALYECDLSAGLRERVADWLLNLPEEGASEEALARWVALNIKPDTSAPDKNEMERFCRLVEVLNIEERGADTEKAKRRRVFDRRFATWAAAMVSVLIAAGAGLMVFDGERTADIEFYDVTEVVLEADGDGEKFTLPDGSNVTLEEGSRVVYWDDFVSDRRVGLDGEAFFDVACDEANPFTVNNEGLSVVVLGTEFKMKARNNIPEAEIVLVSGSVAVEIGDQRHRLAPNHRMTLDKSTLSVVEHSHVGPGEMMRVTGGDLNIDNLHAVDALRMVADYFGKKLVVEEGLGSRNYLNIVLPRDVTLEKALVILGRLSDNAKFKVQGDAIHVSRK